MSVPVTSLYAGLLSLMLVVLTIRVIKRRWSKKIGILDGGDQEMAQAIRVHGNFTEYVPMILLLMVIFELNGVSLYVLHAMGITVLLTRVLHSIGLSRTTKGGLFRVYGMRGTVYMLAAAGCGAVLWPFMG